MPDITDIIKHYESCLEKYGDNHLGVDWPNAEDAAKRYRVMLDIIRIALDERNPLTLLDFGCGTGHLLEFIQQNQFVQIDYSGLDISPSFIQVAGAKFPSAHFYCGNILEEELNLPFFDYIVMNGVFTEKRSLTFDDMWSYFTQILPLVYTKCSRGLAFNVMSKNVDWERDDLFHVPLDRLSAFLCKELTRNFIIRNDYGLYEYTVYILKNN